MLSTFFLPVQIEKSLILHQHFVAEAKKSKFQGLAKGCES